MLLAIWYGVGLLLCAGYVRKEKGEVLIALIVCVFLKFSIILTNAANPC